jgi:hypothetical protein
VERQLPLTREVLCRKDMQRAFAWGCFLSEVLHSSRARLMVGVLDLSVTLTVPSEGAAPEVLVSIALPYDALGLSHSSDLLTAPLARRLFLLLFHFRRNGLRKESVARSV